MMTDDVKCTVCGSYVACCVGEDEPLCVECAYDELTRLREENAALSDRVRELEVAIAKWANGVKGEGEKELMDVSGIKRPCTREVAFSCCGGIDAHHPGCRR